MRAVKKELKLSDRIYRCDSCGNEIDRDEQASINLLNLIKKSGVANAVRSPELRSILADLNKNQLANLAMKA
ncbi:zinc ribbon domain-containing protein [uncultured Ruminobacter sp.]|uniref:zinc ribbon domain-containing protein n=1 Tax=uncultured Ruminobacter sp. TaxID=538947 RepID=UPI00261069B7|nr:zinc ribbon domain-containing protein [uncultured Ruminobacter sp.]